MLVAAALVDPDLYRRYWRAIFVGTCLVIAFVLLVGHAAHGSTRWISLGFFTFQPSEFGKLLFVLALAGMLSERQRDLNRWGTTLKVVGLGLVPVLLVFAPARPRHRARLHGRARGDALRRRRPVAAPRRARQPSSWSSWSASSGPARRPASACSRATRQQRLTCFIASVDVSGRRRLQPRAVEDDGRLRPGSAAAASNDSTQVKLGFLPESQTDFVFSGFAEQRGFVGAVILLGLYLLVLWRGLRVITVARDLFSAIAAGGIVIALLFQIFVNVGMTMGIAPITGIPLPFVSVGGSSLIANLAAMGVLLAIHARGRVSRYSRRR